MVIRMPTKIGSLEIVKHSQNPDELANNYILSNVYAINIYGIAPHKTRFQYKSQGNICFNSSLLISYRLPMDFHKKFLNLILDLITVDLVY